ncbi:sodium/calcium exchanger NCL-like [Cynara cardunculus var. scolymus]|uniref:sodium/calcium exchanger NCL-like n=1 Tax=Cynara cardunculus var. scolymus TaxID=59895 RepID=UPI000D62E6D5|nr:sodium/calcium exchanger NCL-like [Cynara cardunculus var. scolymus]
MGKVVTIIASYSTFFLLLLAEKAVVGRHLQYDVAAELQVSDGVNDFVVREEEPLLHFKGMDSSEAHCQQMYGFLPCSSNVPSHIFLIVIYEYLLHHGESYAGGDGRISRVFGDNYFAAIFSQLLDSLPESLILLASGLTCSKEKAQDYIVTGAGLLAGSSVFHITFLWGVCFICGRTQFYIKPGSKVPNRVVQLLIGSGVVTDAETSYHAKVMFFSLIPFLVILLPSVFGLSYSSQGYKITILVSLYVSVICLFAYFIYQYSDSDKRIKKRRMGYAKVEEKVEMHVPFYEVQSLMLDREKHLHIRQKEMEKMLNDPETNNETMTKKEFYGTFKEWLDVTRQLMDDPYSLDRSGTKYNKVAIPLLEDKRELMKQINHMMESASGENLLKGGALDKSIDRFFEKVDTDKSGSITEIELKNFIMEVNYKEVVMEDDIAEIMMRHLDIDGNKDIDKEEFKLGIAKWVKEINHVNRQKEINHVDQQKTDGYQIAEAKAKFDEKFKAIILLVVGIFMLTVLAEPLVESVREFSESVKIEPFFVSFILVPLATNARSAMAAIKAAKQKRHSTTSLTLSEIYHKVFMNNVLGFFVLVSVIYFRDLTWHFSAEILVVVIVCIIMGILTSFRSKFPNWTLLIAFPLYLLSLVVIYFVDDTFQFT